MISKLIAVLLGIDAEITSEDIADTLWLALEMKKKSVERSDVVNQISSDGGATSSEGPNELLSQGKVSVPPEQPVAEQSAPEPLVQASGTQTQSMSSGLYPGSTQGSNGKGKQMGTLPFRSPAATALPGSHDIARTLRPFRRLIPLPGQFILNEEATAKRIAEEGLWVPVLEHASTRWLEVALVVDRGASMTIWRQTIVELHRLLARHGAFRDVRLWELDTNDPGKVYLYVGTGAGIQNRQIRSESELIDTSGRRLILVVTDCVSPAWRSGIVAETLEKWGRYNAVTIVQVLPQRLWSRTALGMITPVRLHASIPGVPNKQLLVRATHHGRNEDKGPRQRIAIPIITLEPRPLTAWSRVIARAEDVWIPGFELAIPSQAARKPEQNGYTLYEKALSVTLSPAERVQRFRADASSPARRLAGLLAMVPITLPIIRLVQQAILPDSRQVHVAEVFLSGLLEVTSAKSDTLDPDAVEYDFVDSEHVRELLLNSVSPNDSGRVLTEVSAFIAGRPGHALDFHALLADPFAREGVVIDEENRPFALMGAKALRRFGGEYVALADWLEEKSHKSEEQDDRMEGMDGQRKLQEKDVASTQQQEVVGGSPTSTFVETSAQEGKLRLVDEDALEIKLPYSLDEMTKEREEHVEASPQKLKDFVISYHNADQTWAEWISYQLEEAGYYTVLQVWNFQHGADFAVEMDKASRVAERIIIIFSHDYLHVLSTRSAWTVTFVQTLDEGRGPLLPIRVNDNDPGRLLRPIEYLDLVGLNKGQAREKLLMFVESRSSKKVSQLRRLFRRAQRLLLREPPFPGSLFSTSAPIKERPVVAEFHRIVYYTNAKVVLVGDSGVGKSGLGLVLAGKPFVPTESTHGQHVWTIDRQEIDREDGHRETREILLWDLAGQPDYRLIHQLHLDQVAVALVVFDARNETDPFAGVQHWDRALRQAQLVQRETPPTPTNWKGACQKGKKRGESFSNKSF